MPGVLASSFCVVPVSSGPPNTASSSLFVHVELGTQTGLVQLIALSQQCMASFKDLHIIGGSRRYWQLFSSIDPYTVVSNCCCNGIFLCDLCGDSLGNFFFHGMSGGFISCMQSLIKPMCFGLGFYEALGFARASKPPYRFFLKV